MIAIIPLFCNTDKVFCILLQGAMGKQHTVTYNSEYCNTPTPCCCVNISQLYWPFIKSALTVFQCIVLQCSKQYCDYDGAASTQHMGHSVIWFFISVSRHWEILYVFITSSELYTPLIEKREHAHRVRERASFTLVYYRRHLLPVFSISDKVED